MTKEYLEAFSTWKAQETDKLKKQYESHEYYTGRKISWDTFCRQMFQLSEHIIADKKVEEEIESNIPYTAFPYVNDELKSYIRHCLIRLDFECPHEETKLKIWTLIVALMTEISAANERNI